LRARPQTLSDWLDRAAGHPRAGLRFLDRHERETWRSWADVRGRAVEVCGSLQAAGIAPGERVALVYPTGPEFFDAFFGILLAGAVPVPLYPPVRLGRMQEYQRRTARMVELAGVRLVLADGRVRRFLGEAIRASKPGLGCRTLDGLPGGAGRPVPADPDALALVQFSSGTTVAPKPVALSHRALVAQTLLLNGYWPDDEEVRHSGASWLPLYHDMGLVGCVFPALERPSRLTLIPPEAFIGRPALWLRAISRYRATISPAPNFAYGMCVSRIADDELDGVDLSSWRVALNGAETVVPSVMRAFAERFARWGFRAEALTPVYGMSEAALAVTFSDPRRAPVGRRFDRDVLASHGRAESRADGLELASVGRPLPGFELRIVGKDGAACSEGRVGSIRVKGPSLMDGYLDRPQATRRVLRDGWFDTGDLGFLLDGELYLTGRAKDVLLLRGRNHAPEEVERAVDGVRGVRTGCSVAVSHLPAGAESEELVLFVERARTATGAELDRIAADCRDAVLGSTGLMPGSVLVLDRGTLPRTSSGKLRRRETLRQFLAGELRPPEPVTWFRITRQLARSMVAYTAIRQEDSGA
jgi:acyl-CoA synthetase (AMP-forming)/AMP-acid ligase II